MLRRARAIKCRTANGVTTNYLVDTNNLAGYAQVVEELQNNQVVKTYTYGLDLISQRSSAVVNFYQYDGHGSVRGLTDSSANLTDTYAYDAFGTITEQTGTTANNYLYASEQFDADLGFYYNRARYLNAETGRFWSMDDYEGVSSEPKSLHKFLYTSNDAVNKIDPSGYAEATLPSQLIGFATDLIVKVLPVIGIASVACAIEASATVLFDIDPVTACGVKPPKRILYHYTDVENVPLILGSGVIWASGSETLRDAVYGEGQYFTDISPFEATINGSMTQFAYALYRFPLKWGSRPKPIGYVAVNVAKLNVERVSPTYGSRFALRSIFLHRSSIALIARGKIEGSGVVPFIA